MEGKKPRQQGQEVTALVWQREGEKGYGRALWRCQWGNILRYTGRESYIASLGILHLKHNPILSVQSGGVRRLSEWLMSDCRRQRPTSHSWAGHCFTGTPLFLTPTINFREGEVHVWCDITVFFIFFGVKYLIMIMKENLQMLHKT